MLRFGCIAIVFYSLSTLSNGILQGINKLRLPVINAAIALVLHLGLLAILMLVFHMDIFAVIYANIFYAALMCVLNQIGIAKAANYHMNIGNAFLKPIAASACMGVLVYGVYAGVSIVFHNAVSTVIAVLAGIFSYFILLILFRGITKEELLRFPGGKFFVKIGTLMRVY